MNVAGSASNSPPVASQCEPGAGTGERRGCDADRGDQRAAFESALRAKEQPGERGQQEQQAEDEPTDAAAAAQFAGAVFVALPVRHAVSQVHQAAGAVNEKTRAQAAIEAALNAHALPGITAVGEADPSALWEVSVREPNAIAVDARVLRAEKTAHDPHAAITVALSSSSVDAEVLARHAPRLNERLRKQGAGFTHVRIERDEPEAE